jgi:hypothetical protein
MPASGSEVLDDRVQGKGHPIQLHALEGTQIADLGALDLDALKVQLQVAVFVQ